MQPRTRRLMKQKRPFFVQKMQLPSSTLALALRLTARVSVQPRTAAMQEPSSTFAVKLKFTAALSRQPRSRATQLPLCLLANAS